MSDEREEEFARAKESLARKGSSRRSIFLPGRPKFLSTVIEFIKANQW
jgi:hypothetical protein